MWEPLAFWTRANFRLRLGDKNFTAIKLKWSTQIHMTSSHMHSSKRLDPHVTTSFVSNSITCTNYLSYAVRQSHAGDVLLNMDLDFEAMGGKRMITLVSRSTAEGILSETSSSPSSSPSRHRPGPGMLHYHMCPVLRQLPYIHNC